MTMGWASGSADQSESITVEEARKAKRGGLSELERQAQAQGLREHRLTNLFIFMYGGLAYSA